MCKLFYFSLKQSVSDQNDLFPECLVHFAQTGQEQPDTFVVQRFKKLSMLSSFNSYRTIQSLFFLGSVLMGCIFLGFCSFHLSFQIQCPKHYLVLNMATFILNIDFVCPLPFFLTQLAGSLILFVCTKTKLWLL